MEEGKEIWRGKFLLGVMYVLLSGICWGISCLFFCESLEMMKGKYSYDVENVINNLMLFVL